MIKNNQKYKELTLREIQKESLDILQDVHTFCKGHGIKYSLAYGSLIGAIRHKGFIPWDDDIDIFMPRNDYERFCKEYSSSRYVLLSESDPSSYINFSRVYDNKKTFVETQLPFAKDYSGGLWIDVFPMDGADDNYDSYLEKMKRLRRPWILQLRYRNASGPFRNLFLAPTLKDFFILLTIKLFSPIQKRILEINQYLKKEAQAIPYGTTNRWTDYCVINVGDNNYHLIEEFDKVVEWPFEDRFFYVLQGYDQVLRRRYGDYMKLPPEKDRVPKQGHTHFYWK